MTVAARDPVVTLYRTLLAYGVVAAVILTLGLVEYLHFEPFGKPATVPTLIVGVYTYDSATHRTSGADQQTFARNQTFAVVVDWSKLPDTMVVQALWYDGFGNVVGRAGPGQPSELSGETIIPVAVPEGLKYHLPGQYIFAVEQMAGGRPVSVLARRIVEVERS